MIVLEACKRCKVSLLFVHDAKDRRVPVDGLKARCAYSRCEHALSMHGRGSGGECFGMGCPCAYFVKPYQFDRRLHTDHRKLCAGRRQPHHTRRSHGRESS